MHDNIGVALVNVPAVAVYVKVVGLTTCNTVVVNGSVALNPLIPEALLTPVIVTLCPVLRECGVVVTTVAIFDALAIVYILNVVVDPITKDSIPMRVPPALLKNRSAYCLVTASLSVVGSFRLIILKLPKFILPVAFMLPSLGIYPGPIPLFTIVFVASMPNLRSI